MGDSGVILNALGGIVLIVTRDGRHLLERAGICHLLARGKAPEPR